ncbi:hypothetical protein GEA64_16550 [Photorhabdus khanii]|uniref:Uncharacterized protein n=1 Tax=Photorhabdus khanii TaxID=1004150 RepID=A0A7C9KHE9_9GAMM|nr:hypothetical protein [Photorhabdus khanii]
MSYSHHNSYFTTILQLTNSGNTPQLLHAN